MDTHLLVFVVEENFKIATCAEENDDHTQTIHKIKFRIFFNDINDN